VLVLRVAEHQRARVVLAADDQLEAAHPGKERHRPVGVPARGRLAAPLAEIEDRGVPLPSPQAPPCPEWVPARTRRHGARLTNAASERLPASCTRGPDPSATSTTEPRATSR
jgi:hypothetical protein